MHEDFNHDYSKKRPQELNLDQGNPWDQPGSGFDNSSIPQGVEDNYGMPQIQEGESMEAYQEKLDAQIEEVESGFSDSQQESASRLDVLADKGVDITMGEADSAEVALLSAEAAKLNTALTNPGEKDKSAIAEKAVAVQGRIDVIEAKYNKPAEVASESKVAEKSPQELAEEEAFDKKAEELGADSQIDESAGERYEPKTEAPPADVVETPEDKLKKAEASKSKALTSGPEFDAVISEFSGNVNIPRSDGSSVEGQVVGVSPDGAKAMVRWKQDGQIGQKLVKLDKLRDVNKKKTGASEPEDSYLKKRAEAQARAKTIKRPESAIKKKKSWKDKLKFWKK